MDPMRFLGLEPLDEHRYRLAVTPGVATAARTIFGGCAHATVVAAAERTVGRALIFSALAFPSTAFLEEVIELTVTPVAEGRRITSARIVATKGEDEPVFAAHAALGEPGDDDLSARWLAPLEVPPVEACELRTPREGTSDARVEFRPARIRTGEDRHRPSPDGRFALWLRVPELEPGIASLALLGDYVNAGVGQSLGERTTSKSLDNTLRVVRRPTDEWVLLDGRIQAVSGGLAQCEGRLYDRAGELLAIAQQTTTARRR